MKSNQKQQKDVELEQKRQQLSEKYDSIRKEFAYIYDIPEDSEPEEYLDIPSIGGKLNTLFSSKDEWIEGELKKYKNERLIVPHGKIQDRNEIYVTYHQKFVEALRDTTPQAFEDLREGISSFNVLFGKETKNFDEVITDLMLETLPYRITPSGTYRPFNDSYIWGNYKRLFLFTYLNSEGGDVSEELSQFYKSEKEILGTDLLHRILTRYIEGFESVIQKSFQNTATDKNQILPHFLKLQNLIYLWADRYHLHKDWLIEYAYFILSQMSKNEKIPVKEITIELKKYKPETLFDPFEFKASGWWASKERAEDYRKRVTKEFEDALTYYFDSGAREFRLGGEVGNLLLNKTLKITKPKDPDFDSIKWLIAWNEGATYPQIAQCFGRSQRAIEKGIELLVKDFELPKRFGHRGRKGKNHSFLSDHRLNEIKATEIPKLSV